MASRQTSNPALRFSVEEFLKSGWVFGLGDGRIALGWGEGAWSSQPKTGASSSDLSIYAPDFYLESKRPWFSTTHSTILTRSELADLIPVASDRPEINWNEPALNDFAIPFQRLKAAFAEDLATKGVPVVFARGESATRPESLLWLLSHALSAPKAVRLYGVWEASGGILGLTPEVLFERYGISLKSMALAGTKRGQIDAQSEAAFLADEKERYEHQLVVDGIRESLGRLGPVKVGETGLLRLPTLAHLLTPVSVEISEAVSFEQIVATLHPTPALGVAPRALGLDWMKTWDEPETRVRFGAPFGLSQSGGQECLVAIRNVQWQDSESEMTRSWQLGSGCGVVPQSELESEWQELFAKRQSVRKLLDI